MKSHIMKVYVIGDSISIHYGPYLEKYLRGFMKYERKTGEAEALLNLDNPQGANGGDSARVLDFLRGMAASGGIDADILLLNCGLHDIKTNPTTGLKQVPIENYKANLREIIKVVLQMKIKMIWIRTTPCDEKKHNNSNMKFYRFSADCQQYNHVADEIMAEFDIKSIDLYNFTLNLGPDLYCDHVHFHEHIREKQAAFIAGWLLREINR